MALTESEELELLELERQRAKGNTSITEPPPVAPAEQKTLQGFGKNVLLDAAANIKANSELASYSFPPLAAMKGVQGQNVFNPNRVVGLGKALFEGAKGLPGQMYQSVRHPLESGYKRPISTALDIGTVASLGTSTARALIPRPRVTAQNLALKAFGNTKRFLNNPIKEAAARNSVQTLMDEGILKPWSTTEDLIARTSEQAERSGRAIGKYLENRGRSGQFFDPSEAVDMIEQLRPRSEQGQLLQGGAFDIINKKIDRAIETINAYNPKESTASPRPVSTEGSAVREVNSPFKDVDTSNPHKASTDFWTGNIESNPNRLTSKSGVTVTGGGKTEELFPTKSTSMVGGKKNINWTGIEPKPTISWKDANALKRTLQDLADWKSNKEATLLDRVIAGRFRELLDKSLGETSVPAGDITSHAEFLKNKRLYSAAMNQSDPLYNMLSSDLGNRGISLTDWIVAAAQLGTGNPLTAVATVGAKKAFEKLGPQTGAVILNKAAKIKPRATSRLAGAGLILNASRNRQQSQREDNKKTLGLREVFATAR